MKRTIPKILALLSLFISLSLVAQTTTSFKEFEKIETASKLIQVERSSIAGVKEGNDNFVSVKRIDHPGLAGLVPDSAHIAAKNKLTWENINSQGVRRNALVDSLRVNVAYEANTFNNVTPMDNNIAVSNGGIVVSVVNTNIYITDSVGTRLQSRVMNASFFDNAALNSTIYDPKVLYDPDYDRFILVILHGSNSTTSRVLVCFSRSNNPAEDGWNVYTFNGNAFLNNLWFDYPNIGINSKELFITGNLFTNTSNSYANKVVFQIGKENGYDGTTLNSRLWGAASGGAMLRNDDNNLPFTMVPAPYAFVPNTMEDMYFVSTVANGGSKIYLYRITNTLDKNPSIEVTSAGIQMFRAERFSSQRNTGVLLISGDARIKNAYMQNGIIHTVHTSASPSNFSSINYTRIDINSRLATNKVFFDEANDYAFAAIAPFSNNEEDPTALIVYTSSSVAKFPEIGVITCNREMAFSKPKVVKDGESFVSIFTSNNSTRWGDYSGIHKRYGTGRPEVWISACYGANTPNTQLTRHWRNYNAQILSKEGEEVLQVNSQVSIWPNPVQGSFRDFNLAFNAAEDGTYTVEIYDMVGKRIRQVYEDILVKGNYRLVFSANDLSIGTYLLVINRNGENVLSERILIADK